MNLLRGYIPYKVSMCSLGYKPATNKRVLRVYSGMTILGLSMETHTITTPRASVVKKNHPWSANYELK